LIYHSRIFLLSLIYIIHTIHVFFPKEAADAVAKMFYQNDLTMRNTAHNVFSSSQSDRSLSQA
jgi:hypothetical protein